MLYATMAATLRRRLQDVAEDAYADAVINEYLDVGISVLQAHIHAINPAAFITTDTFATVSGTDLYVKQASSLRVIRAEMSKAAGGYEKLPFRNFLELIEEDTAFEEGAVALADLGNQWYMHPTPDAIKTVRVWYVPELTTSTLWDANATRVPTVLHPVAIDSAFIEAVAEGTDAPALDEARRRLGEKLALIPSLYGGTAEQVAALSMSPFSSSGR